MVSCETVKPKLSSPPATLGLQLIGGYRPGPIFPLEGPKVALGAGKSCQVQLQESGVRPLHCLIAQNPEGLTVRRWADDTLLNGQTFTEAPLQLNDVLTVGTLDLLVVEMSAQSNQAATPPSEPSPIARSPRSKSKSAVPPPKTSLPTLIELPLRQFPQLSSPTISAASSSPASRGLTQSSQASKAVRVHARRRVAALVQAVRKARQKQARYETDYDELRDQIGHLTQVSHDLDRKFIQLQEEHQYLQGNYEQLQSAHEQLSKEKHQVAAQAKEQQASLESQLEEQQLLVEKLSAEIEQLLAENDALMQQSVAQAPGLAEAVPAGTPPMTPTNVDTLPPTALAEWSDLPQHEPHDVAGGDAMMSTPLGTQGELPTESTVLSPDDSASVSREAEFRRELSELTQAILSPELPDEPIPATAELQPPPSVPPESVPSAPTDSRESFIDKYRHMFDDQEQSSELPLASPSMAAESMAVELPPTAPAASLPSGVHNPSQGGRNEEEEALDDYLSQLMSRLRSQSSDGTSQEPTSGQSSSGPSKGAERAAVSERETPTASPDETPAEPPRPPATAIRDIKELRGGPAPEKNYDLSALRNVANSSARQAIHVASKKQAKSKAVQNLTTSGLIGIIGVALLIAVPQGLSLPVYAGIAALSIALYWGFRIVDSLLNRLSEEEERENE